MTAVRRPNILCILTDQQHWRMLSCAGNTDLQTPNLDALAASGVRCDCAFTTNPICMPARFSLQTGLMPSCIGVWNNGDPARRETRFSETLAPLLRGAGYATYYGGKTHLPFPLEQCGYSYITDNRRDGLADAAIALLRTRQTSPFFAFLSFINPHDICYKAGGDFNPAYCHHPGHKTVRELEAQIPVEPAQRAAWVKANCPELPDNHEASTNEPDAINRLSPNAIRAGVAEARARYSKEDWRIHRWLYARLTEKVDREIGRVLDALHDNQALAEQTVVLFTSDHGELDSAHRLTQKSALYEEAVRVPLIVSQPGCIRGGRVDRDHMISIGLDLLPTLCDYAGINPPAHCAGRSIRGICEGLEQPDWRKYVISESAYGRGRMVRTPSHKYCHYPLQGAQCVEQFFDLAADPGEMCNLVGSKALESELQRHRTILWEWESRFSQLSPSTAPASEKS